MPVKYNQLTIYRHLIIWMGILLFFLLLQDNKYGLLFSLSSEAVNVSFYALIVYFNWFYLIPNYLSEKDFFVYSFLLLLAAIILATAKTMVYNLLFFNYPELILSVKQNQWWIFLLLFIAGGASTVIKIALDWMDHQSEKADLVKENLQSEINFLKSQINPHFLFNTLNSVYALSLKKSDKAPEIIVKLSEILRYMLYESNEKRVPLSREIDNLQNYLDLEKIRHSDKTIIEIDIEGEIENQKISPLLLTPFVENAFKHGAKSADSDNYVYVKVRVDRNHFYFNIVNNKSDNYFELNPENQGGIGLINVRRRLDLLYKDGYNLNLKSTPNDFIVELDIDLNAINIKYLNS